MHIFITGYKMTDHINHNGLNNMKSNLRETTNQLNKMNSRPHRRTRSKYKGVFWRKERRHWIAKIQINKKLIYIGSYADEKAAGQAYNRQAKKLFGQHAFLNKISKT